MTPPIIALLSVCSAVAVLLLVLVVRAIAYKPKETYTPAQSPVIVDADRATETLSQMIKCKTVSDRNKDNEDEAEFVKFKELLPKLFPKVYEKCTVEEIKDRAILIKWEGKSHSSPTVLMSHYDVVSAVEENWEKPAFEGIVESGVLWGRGAIDTKGTLNGILTAAEMLISEGFVPNEDIYFAFGGDEEINGHGAKDIVDLFVERGINPSLVVDEGGGVVRDVFPGVKEPCALIGIAEKGMVNIEYSVSGGGGHASSPTPPTPVGRLSRACVKMEKSFFKFRLTEPARKMIDTLGRHSSFALKIVFANLWLFSPLINLIAKMSGGEFNALMRTTVAFTQMEGSLGINVIPPTAKMASNQRIIPGETVESVRAEIEKRVKKHGVSVKAIEGMNPSNISSTECEGWERISKATKDTWQDSIVSPYLMVACSDARHWSAISDRVYRFSAMALSKEERGTVHGNNERLPKETVAKIAEFYLRLMRMS